MPNRDLGDLDPYLWEDGAACKGADTELFFPPRIKGVYEAMALEAKSYCNGVNNRKPCPVRDQCREWAIETDELFGIFGGMSHRERNALVRKRRKASAKQGDK